MEISACTSLDRLLFDYAGQVTPESLWLLGHYDDFTIFFHPSLSSAILMHVTTSFFVHSMMSPSMFSWVVL